MSHVLLFFHLVTIVLFLGGLITAAVGIAPTFAALSPERYAETHQLLDRYLDPYMPVTGILLTLTTIGELWFSQPWQIVSRIIGLLGMIALMTISARIHGPLNQRIRAWRADLVDESLTTTRKYWILWHQVRAILACICLVSFFLPIVIPI